MPTGDYAVEGYESQTIIERKKDLFEIYGNVIRSEGRRRFIDELKRLKDECRFPVLLLEGQPPVLTGTPAPRNSLGLNANDLVAARDELAHLLLAHGVQYAILPARTLLQRRAVAEWAISLLLAGATNASLNRSTEPDCGGPSGVGVGGARFPLFPSQQ